MITGYTIQRRITTSSKGLIEARIGRTASVQFIHLSVNDFLFRNQRLQTLDPTLQPDPISASHGQLWDRCWSDIKRLANTSTSEQYMRDLGDNYLFLQYAAGYVFDHADKALSGGAMRQEIAGWLQTRNDWFGWWKTFLSTVDRRGEHSYLKESIDAGHLYMLSLCGYQGLVTVVLAEGSADVNVQGGYFGNALQGAVAGGHAEIVRQLLEHSADVNAQGGHYGNALQAAVAGGHAEIVRQLLEHSADVSADVHRADRQKEVVPETVLENGAKCLALGTYVSLHMIRLWVGAILPLTGWLIVRFLRSRHPDFPGLRPLGVAALGVNAWRAFGAWLGFRKPFDP